MLRLLALILFSFGTICVAANTSQQALAQSMATRLPLLTTEYINGTIGESYTGFVVAYHDTAPQALINAENQDRKQLFTLLSKQTGGSTTAVAELFSKKLYSRLPTNTWLLNKDLSWTRKTN